MSTQQVADKLTSLCSQGKFHDAMEALYSPDIVSVEAAPGPDGVREQKGIDAIRAKGEWWTTNHEVHDVKVAGPLVAGPYFSVTFKLDITFKPTGKRSVMEEVGVYKVVDGKVVHEEFFYQT